MRLVAICLAGLLLMQLPAAASIVSCPAEVEGRLASHRVFGYLTWDAAHGTLCLSTNQSDAGIEPIQLVFAPNFPNLGISDPSLPSAWAVLDHRASDDLALFASWTSPTDAGLADLDWTKIEEQAALSRGIHEAAGSVCPEPATLTIWGISALALAAATYRRQKRGGRNSKHVQAAVREYLEACDSPSDHFRMLGSYLTRLADDPQWTKQDVEAFYDEVVLALHRRREHAEVA